MVVILLLHCHLFCDPRERLIEIIIIIIIIINIIVINIIVNIIINIIINIVLYLSNSTRLYSSSRLTLCNPSPLSHLCVYLTLVYKHSIPSLITHRSKCCG